MGKATKKKKKKKEEEKEVGLAAMRELGKGIKVLGNYQNKLLMAYSMLTRAVEEPE